MMETFATPRRDAPRCRPFSSNGPCVTAVPVRGAKEAHMATGTIKRIVADLTLPLGSVVHDYLT